jgi:hypothetical protein
VPRTPENRPERDIVTDQLEPKAPAREKASSSAGRGSGRSATTSGSTKPRSSKAAQPPVTGVVGDASDAVTRSGEDVRRRGWFWHWNNIVTQYAPLIGLKGVGLINSYTVWTDRRESSPHRGYAFPSQQSEADFYGEDRAELITVNKLLVALDLIEIRKEMVPRTDEKGRRWKVPHNLYRVKDHDDDFQLTTQDVMKVVELADRDRAVYRYVRRMFSPKFSPIDSQNVWHGILEEVRQDPTWQKLAEKTARDESKASARSKAGHASRRTNDPTTAFSLPNDSDNPEPEVTGGDSGNDSTTVEREQPEATAQTSVAKTNNGSATTDEPVNNGFDENPPPSVAPINTDGPTSVQPTNTMYYQSLTTTTTEAFDEIAGGQRSFGPEHAPDQARAETGAIRFFEEANDRVSTPAERRLLRQLADQFDAAAREQGGSGWLWLGMAIDDAVGAGSAFVAPKRIREILARWQRDGLPEEHAAEVASLARSSQLAGSPVTNDAGASHRPSREPSPPQPGEIGAEPFVTPVFMIEACGLTNRQVWSAVMGDLHQSGGISQADVSTWLRDAAVLDCGSDEIVIGVPHELARRRATGRYVGAIRQSLERVTGLRLEVSVILFRDWEAA